MQFEKTPNQQEQETYEAPQVIYEGEISTRAGSPPPPPSIDGDATDLFGD
jgi:hypothetical protein